MLIQKPQEEGECDTERSTNKQTRVEKAEAAEVLHAEIDELQASTEKHTEEMVELKTAVADIDKTCAKASWRSGSSEGCGTTRELDENHRL